MKLIELLDDLGIDVNTRLLKELKMFRIRWITRNREGIAEHIDFLSSDLVGVYPVMFSKDDIEEIFDILGIDGKTFRKDLKKVEDINPEFKNITEPIYVLMLYIMFKIHTGKFSNKLKEEMIVMTTRIVVYKMVSSILHHYYGNYNVSMSHALLTRERLHGNSLLSKLGSWDRVIQNFTKAVTEDDGLHGKRLRNKFKVDDLTYIISNTKTGINSFVFNSNMVLLTVKDSDSSHSLNKAYTEGDDGAIMQDHKNIHFDLMRVSKLLLATGDFKNNDVIEILFSTYIGLNKDDLINGVNIVIDLHNEDPQKMGEILNLLFETTIFYLYIDKLHPPYNRNVIKIIEYLKNYYTSSRVRDKRLTEVKEFMQDVMQKRLKYNNRRSIAISNTVMVYMFILGNLELHAYR